MLAEHLASGMKLGWLSLSSNGQSSEHLTEGAQAGATDNLIATSDRYFYSTEKGVHLW